MGGRVSKPMVLGLSLACMGKTVTRLWGMPDALVTAFAAESWQHHSKSTFQESKK
jgi:hypothetical protein